MAAALLPWEIWIGRLAHLVRRKRSLSASAAWPEAEGVVCGIKQDVYYPRDEIIYSYSTNAGYYSGSYWRWFNRGDVRFGKPGDKIRVRYNPEKNGESVFLSFK